ncbi:MAG TPA: hypothetical protein EYP56_17330 [Planctomycetaceae bacterium]|nr:hypothetical protein [Planctomycetaceae bacterium]
MSVIRTLCALATMLSLPPVAAELPMAVPATGEPFAAEIVSIGPSWQIAFRAGDQLRKVAAAELAWWGSFRESAHRGHLILADGGLLAATLLEADQDIVVADAGRFGLVRLPWDFVAAAVLLPPAVRHERDRLLGRILTASTRHDQVILANGDELAGRVAVIRDDKLQLETDVGAVDVSLHRIRAVIFDPGLLRRLDDRPLRALVGLADGSRLVARRLVAADQTLTITLADGSRWERPLDQLVGLQVLGGKVVYLSDLEPVGYRHLPYLELRWPYRRDRHVADGLLRAGGRLYLKGLGMHSASRLSYQLDGQYQRFQAEVAIDDSAEGGGSVRFAVSVDGQLKYTSPVVRGHMPPVPVSVDVRGAQRLDLVVDFADRGDVLDRADWLNARLVRSVD